MCPDRISVTWYILRGALGDAERAVPGKGCELLHAFAAVADMAMIVGAASALFLAWLAFDLVAWLRRRRERRHAD